MVLERLMHGCSPLSRVLVYKHEPGSGVSLVSVSSWEKWNCSRVAFGFASAFVLEQQRWHINPLERLSTPGQPAWLFLPSLLGEKPVQFSKITGALSKSATGSLNITNRCFCFFFKGFSLLLYSRKVVSKQRWYDGDWNRHTASVAQGELILELRDFIVWRDSDDSWVLGAVALVEEPCKYIVDRLGSRWGVLLLAEWIVMGSPPGASPAVPGGIAAVHECFLCKLHKTFCYQELGSVMVCSVVSRHLNCIPASMQRRMDGFPVPLYARS